MEPRIPLVEADSSPEEHALLDKTKIRPSEEPRNLFRLLVRHPELMKRVNALGGIFMAHSTLSARLREFVILRSAHRSGSEYELAQHFPLAKSFGLSDEEIRAASLDPDSPDMVPEFASIARFTDRILDVVEPEDDLWREMSRQFSDREMLELCLIPGFYRMLAGMLVAVRVPIEDWAQPQ